MVTLEHLREILSYEPSTGLFHWLQRTSRNTRAGQQAGCFDPAGYALIRIGGRNYLGHRLAWFYVHGRWPTAQIDHVNLVKSDNRLSNLREATASQNSGNKRALRNNKCGLKGVRFDPNRKKWRATLYTQGKPRHLGMFLTKEDAHHAYWRAAEASFGEFARG